MAKVTFTKLTTPKGVAQYPWITKPDTRFNPEGDYKINLVLPEDEAQSVTDKIDAEIEKAYQEAIEKAKTPGDAKKIKKADPPYVCQEDDNGDKTGNVIIKFKQKAVIKAKSGETFKARVNVFDAKGKAVEGDIGIYGGSEVKVAAEMAPYFNAKDKAVGVTLRLKAVQVIKLVSSSGGGDASGFGFDKEEGFSYDADTPPFDAEGIETGNEDF